MKDRSKFRKVGISTLSFCAVLYTVPSLIVYLAYQDTSTPPLDELYYKTFLEHTIIKYMNYLMNLSFVYGICSFTIYNMEMLEKIRLFKNIVRDEEKNLRSFNVLLVRMAFVLLALVVSYFVTDLRLVFAINGTLLNSLIGLVIPGLMGIMRHTIYRRRDSLLVVFSDWVCLLSGVTTFVLFFVDLLPGMK